MPRRKKTFAQRHPEVDKLRVDFLNPRVMGGSEGPLVFLTQKDGKGKDQTLIFHVDIAIKTFKGVLPLLRKFKRAKTEYLVLGDDIDRFTGRPYGEPPAGMNGPKTADGRYGRITEGPDFDEFAMKVIRNDS